METGAANQQKLKSHEVSAEDRISHLSDEIVHRIFDFLPSKNAAETCVLSKRWKHLWYSYPCLDFTFSYWYDRSQRPDCIDHVVRLLEKHSDVKVLRFRGPVGFPSDLKGLMKKAVRRHNVQTLDIEFQTQKPFTLPRCVVKSLSLRDLILKSRFNDPYIRLPPLEFMEDGFKSLQSLSLLGVDFGDEPSLLNLFTDSSFPSLTNLRLESCKGLKFLRIQMPGLRELALYCCREMRELDVSAEKLEKLSVVSCFTDHDASARVKIDAPSLERIVWSCNAIVEECDIGMFDSLEEAVVGLSLGYREDNPSDWKMRSVSNFLTGISLCRCLTVERELLKIVSRCKLCVFERLKSLKVHTCLSKGDARGLASLFRSSPFVDMISISIEKDGFGYHERKKNDFWESEAESLDSFLGRLRFAKVSGFGDDTCDGGFAKFLLKHAKGLQRLSVSKVGYSIMGDIVQSQLTFE